MKTTLSIRMDQQLVRRLTKMAQGRRRSRSELVRELLRRHFALLHFEELRRRTRDAAASRGYVTDEDIFRDLS